MTGPDSARTLLRNPTIECAVLEVGCNGILCSGLGYDRADVAVLTHIDDNHPGLSHINPPPDLVRLNAVVANSVCPGGQIVLNADDERCVQIGNQAGERVVYFSMRDNNPVVERHIRSGGSAVVVRDHSQGKGLFRIDSGKTVFLAHDLSGTVSALAAASACVALGVENECIQQGLRALHA